MKEGTHASEWWTEGTHQIVSKILLIVLLLSTSILFLSFSFKQQLFCTLGVSLKSSQNLIVSYKYMCLDRLVYASCSSLMIIILGAIHFLITGRKAEADLSSIYLTSHFSVIFSIPHKQQCLTFPLPYFPKPNFLSPLSVITHYFLCFLPFFLAFT